MLVFLLLQNYDTSESKLRREFEVYGPVKKVSIFPHDALEFCIICKVYLVCGVIFLQIVVIHNTINGKPRGYAFIEYEHERDMHCK